MVFFNNFTQISYNTLQAWQLHNNAVLYNYKKDVSIVVDQVSAENHVSYVLYHIFLFLKHFIWRIILSYKWFSCLVLTKNIVL